MWKVLVHRTDTDQAPSVFWVEADTAADAAITAYHQARSESAALRHLPPAGPITVATDDEVDDWFAPDIIDDVRVFTAPDEATAVLDAQLRRDIHDGDVVWIPGERIAAVVAATHLMAASARIGGLPAIISRSGVIDGRDYTRSVRVAVGLLSGPLWTVTIAGGERHDGDEPTAWQVAAHDREQAIGKAFTAQLAEDEQPADMDPATPDEHGQPTYLLVGVEPGPPARGIPVTDTRPGSDNIRRHDCLAVEDLRERLLQWLSADEQHTRATPRPTTRPSPPGATAATPCPADERTGHEAEAAAILRHLASALLTGEP
jgi:hypothetical protein